MKTILLGLSAIVLSASAVNAQTRMALHQEFTGENCPPCAATNPGFWSMCDGATNVSKMIHITYMAPIPSAGSYYNETSHMVDSLDNYYSVPFAPYGRFDGAVPDPTCTNPGHPGCMVQSDIDAEAAVPSPLKIVAYHHFNTAHDSVFGRVYITGVSAVTAASLKLRAAYTKSMTFTAAPGSNGENVFENVVRTMFPNTTGQSILNSWSVGTNHMYTYQGKIAGLETGSMAFTLVDSGFVVWVQNDSNTTADRPVLQAARSAYAPAGVAPIENNTSIDLKVFPNPTNANATVRLNLASAAKLAITVYDVVGRVVFELPASEYSVGMHDIEIQTSGLTNGIYNVVVRTNDGIVSEQLSVAK